MKIVLFLLALSFLPVAFGQKTSLLYSIKKSGSKPSYLFGTTHLIADSAYYFPQKLEKTLAKADKLVLEIDNIMDQTAASQLMVLDSGNLFDLFTPEQADSVITWGSDLLHMSPEAFRKGFSTKKPFVLMQIGAQAAIKGPVRSYELELMSKALTNQQSIDGLETMEYQVSLFENLPDSVFRDMVMASIRNPETALIEQQKMTALYKAQDVEGLAALIAESDEMGSSVETLLYQRNRNWIPVMIRLMETHSCFFAVGAGHLGGEQGVIQLLQHAGYTVTPISY